MQGPAFKAAHATLSTHEASGKSLHFAVCSLHDAQSTSNHQLGDPVKEQVLTPCCMLRSAAASFTCSWRAAFSKPGGRVACTARSDTGRTSSWACASPLPTALHGSVCRGRQASQCSKPQALHPTHAWRAGVSAPGIHPECHTASDKGEIVSWV